MVLGLLPGLPTIPFLLLGGGVGLASLRLRQKTDAEAECVRIAQCAYCLPERQQQQQELSTPDGVAPRRGQPRRVRLA